MIINTDRCCISNLQQSDIEKAVRLFTDQSVRCYLGGTLSEETAVEKLNSWINNKKGLYLTVSLLENSIFIGIISVTDHHDGKFKEISYQFPNISLIVPYYSVYEDNIYPTKSRYQTLLNILLHQESTPYGYPIFF